MLSKAMFMAKAIPLRIKLRRTSLWPAQTCFLFILLNHTIH